MIKLLLLMSIWIFPSLSWGSCTVWVCDEYLKCKGVNYCTGKFKEPRPGWTARREAETERKRNYYRNECKQQQAAGGPVAYHCGKM